MKKTKKLGIFMTVLACLLLTVCLAVSWYLGGQKRTLERYALSIARGNASDYALSTGKDPGDADAFKQSTRQRFTGSGDFPDLKENDLIGADVKIKSRKMLTFTRWELGAEVWYFSGKMNRRDPVSSYELVFSEGSWKVTEP